MSMGERVWWLRTDTRAVSSVIGTVLMVALVLVIAAGASLFVLGLAGEKVDMMEGIVKTIPGV